MCLCWECSWLDDVAVFVMGVWLVGRCGCVCDGSVAGWETQLCVCAGCVTGWMMWLCVWSGSVAGWMTWLCVWLDDPTVSVCW